MYKQWILLPPLGGGGFALLEKQGEGCGVTSRFTEFRRKEIINVANGLKIGYVDDIVFDTETAAAEAVVVYGRPRFFGLFGRGEDLLIRWEEIEVIGEDTILVKSEGTVLPRRMQKPSYFDKFFG